MLLNMGKRGKIRFTWKELTLAVITFASGAGNFFWTKMRLDECEKRVTQIEKKMEAKSLEEQGYIVTPISETKREQK